MHPGIMAQNVCMSNVSSDAGVTRVKFEGDIATIVPNCPDSRNAMNDALIGELDEVFSSPPEGVNAVIMTGSGGHYCGGLDLAEHEHLSPMDEMFHSRKWHRVADQIELDSLPVMSALTGSVIGGGLEIAAAARVRIVEPSIRFQLRVTARDLRCRRRRRAGVADSRSGPHARNDADGQSA